MKNPQFGQWLYKDYRIGIELSSRGPDEHDLYLCASGEKPVHTNLGKGVLRKLTTETTIGDMYHILMSLTDFPEHLAKGDALPLALLQARNRELEMELDRAYDIARSIPQTILRQAGLS